VSIFRPWVHPAGFVLVCLLKDGVGNYQAVFHTKVQEHSTIGVFLAEPVSAENLVPELVVLLHPLKSPSTEYFLLARYCLDGTVEVLVEALNRHTQRDRQTDRQTDHATSVAIGRSLCFAYRWGLTNVLPLPTDNSLSCSLSLFNFS